MDINRIFLWGPAGSGKTWLLNSFVRKINLLNRAFESSIFEISVEDEFGNKLLQKGLRNQPTKAVDYQQISYKRLVRSNLYDPELFSNNYIISMLDGPGDETTGQVAKESNNPQTLANVRRARAALKDADFLFIMVHPGIHGSISSGSNETSNDPDKAGEHFIDRLDALRNIKRNPKQKISLCFTQADEYGGELGGANAALASLFGSKSDDIGYLLRQLNESNNELQTYFISSVGYYPDQTNNGKRIPNYDLSSESLLDAELWNPDKVLEPFFDVFDDVHVEFLKRFGKPKNKIAQIMFEQVTVPDRLKLYKEISNKVMLIEGEKAIHRMLY